MRRTAARTLATLAALVPLAGCGIGIPETDVIEAGGPATIDVLPARDYRMLLFFLSPDGRLTPVPRVVDDGFGENYRLPDGVGPETEADSSGGGGSGGQVPLPARPPTEKTVAALLGGPNATEQKSGLRNAPTLPKQAAVTIKVSGGVIDATVKAPLDGVDDLGLRQLVCTIAYAEDAWGRPPVRLTGTDGTRPASDCDTSAVPAPEDADRPTPTVSPELQPAPGP
ncbi:hypothetical protein ACFU9F_18555 [Streptomyces zhihengii]|uniref:hypothetical protein n=1 Tax=Streptomyces zhihengii TaxID=1818004 RepID=UPI003692AF10